jgi:hypothetical protein
MLKRMICLSLFLPVLAAAQMPDLKPPKELDALIPFLGKWESKMEWTMGAEKMNVGMTLEYTREGKFFVGKSVMDAGGMKFTETQYIGWDAEKKNFSSHSFSNWSPAPRVEWGTLKDKTFTFISEPWDSGDGGGKKIVTNSTLTWLNKDSFKMNLEMKERKESAIGTFTRVVK